MIYFKSCLLNKFETTYWLTLGSINPYFSSGHQFVYFRWNLINKHSENVLCIENKMFRKPTVYKPPRSNIHSREVRVGR